MKEFVMRVAMIVSIACSSAAAYAEDLWSVHCDEPALKKYFNALGVVNGGSFDPYFLMQVDQFNKVREFAKLQEIQKELKKDIYREYTFPKPLEAVNEDNDCLKGLGCLKTYGISHKDGSDPTTIGCLGGKIVYLTETPKNITRANLDARYGKPVQTAGQGPAFVRKSKDSTFIYVVEDVGSTDTIEYFKAPFLDYLEKAAQARMDKIKKAKSQVINNLR